VWVFTNGKGGNMKRNSEKRNRKIELSDAAMALRKMRDYRSMSVRDVGDLLNVSFTTVSHMKNGRATIHDEYLKNFLKALKFSMKDFEKFCEGNVKFESLRTKCFLLIERMEPGKLEKIYDRRGHSKLLIKMLLQTYFTRRKMPGFFDLILFILTN
jgi:transcriptional regulator with XRE-family HTH domain